MEPIQQNIPVTTVESSTVSTSSSSSSSSSITNSKRQCSTNVNATCSSPVNASNTVPTSISSNSNEFFDLNGPSCSRSLIGNCNIFNSCCFQNLFCLDF